MNREVSRAKTRIDKLSALVRESKTPPTKEEMHAYFADGPEVPAYKRKAMCKHCGLHSLTNNELAYHKLIGCDMVGQIREQTKPGKKKAFKNPRFKVWTRAERINASQIQG